MTDSGVNNSYIYILRCSDNTLYTGWTNNLENRFAAHNSGKGCKYTRSRLPVRMVYFEEFESKEDALKREYEIKHRLSKKEKENLIKNFKNKYLQTVNDSI